MMAKLKNVIDRFKLYDPKAYWGNRKDPNNKEGVTETLNYHIEYIRAHTKGLKNVFELGPGVGRVFEAYEKGAELTCLDITRNYELLAKERAASLGLKLSFEELLDGGSSFPFPDATFEIGVASQVFLHVPNTDIRKYLSECLRICDVLVVITAYRHNTKASLVELTANHVFNHNYMEICTDLGFTMTDVRWLRNQLYFVVSKKV